MKLKYFKETDSLYIDLSDKRSVESLEIAPGVVVDFDKNNHIVGLDIEHASRNSNLKKLEFTSMPSTQFVFLPVQSIPRKNKIRSAALKSK